MKTDEQRNSEQSAIALQTMRDLLALKLNIASISDIHLNHPNTPTELIIRNLCRYAFPDTKETRDLDLILIDGDFTDRLMDFASDNAILTRKWVAQFLWYCKKHDIVVRVLEGTRLHDWGQAIIFIEENENHNIGCDIKYFKDIAIEHIERFGIDVLYVPDEIRPDTQTTWRDVKALLKQHNLEVVDIASMHGAFEYQLPEPARIQGRYHIQKDYESIVRHFIFIGHVHTHNPKGKVIPNGSFDRLAQGEEGPKGHVRLINGKIKFVENKGAMKYFKVDAVGKELIDIVDEINSRLDDSNEHDKFRVLLLANKGDVAFELTKRLSELYPNGTFDIQNVEKRKKQAERKVIRNRRNMELPVLTRENLLDELINELKVRNPDIVEDCIRVSENIINATR